MVGLWGIGFFSPELITTAFKTHPLQVSDITKPAQVCAALAKPPNPAIEHLKSRLQDETVQKIEATPAGAEVPAETTDLLAKDLNRVIQDDDIYDAEAFRGINLKKGTTNLVHTVQNRGSKRDITLLNRQLVEQLFPGSITELQKTIGKMKGRGGQEPPALTHLVLELSLSRLPHLVWAEAPGMGARSS